MTAVADQAKQLMRGERWQEAIELFQQYEEEVREDAKLAWNLGWAYFKRGEHRRAVRWLERSVELKPKSAVSRWALGEALAAAERFDEAEEQLLRSLALRDAYLARSALGLLYHRTGRLAEAEAVYREGIRLKPDDGRRHGALADFLSDVGRVNEAEQHSEAARTAREHPEREEEPS